MRRHWYRRTIWAIAAARTGRQSTGRTPGTTGERKLHPYAGDPRLQVAAESVAEAQEDGRNRLGLDVDAASMLRSGCLPPLNPAITRHTHSAGK